MAARGTEAGSTAFAAHGSGGPQGVGAGPYLFVRELLAARRRAVRDGAPHRRAERQSEEEAVAGTVPHANRVGDSATLRDAPVSAGLYVGEIKLAKGLGGWRRDNATRVAPYNHRRRT